MKRYSFIIIGISIYGSLLEAHSNELASKGARVEATFILQNKHNTLLEHMQKVKKQLEDAEITRKKLKQERELLSEKLQKITSEYSKLSQQKDAKPGIARRMQILQNEQRQLRSLLSLLDLEVRHASLITDLYPEYSKELDLLSLGLNKAIGEISENESIPYREVRATVDKAFLIRDKINTEARGITLIFELDKKLLTLEHKQQMLTSKEQELTAAESELDSPKTIRQKELLVKQIKNLKRNISQVQESINAQKKAALTLKENAGALHQRIYQENHEKIPSLIQRVLNKNN
jgi:hypothetical protein